MRRLYQHYSAALLLGVAGCAQVEVKQPPAVPLAPAFREAPAAWNAATTAAAPIQAAWWSMYRDPELDALQNQLLANSPDLASALTRYQQARAATDLLRAAQSPTLNTSLNLQRDRQSDNKPLRGTSAANYNSGTLGFDAGYEVDVWGRISQQVANGVAQERAAGADLANARLALQVQLADSLIALRGIDDQAILLNDTAVAYGKAADLVDRRHRGGLSSGLDLARAQAQLESTRSQAEQLQAQRAVLEHAIAALVGANASTFAIAPKPTPAAAQVVPAIPLGLPSELLQRRPDIAAAQLRVAAAGARVNVAKTAFFPSLTLNASAGFQSSDLGNIVQMPNLYWALGPTLAMSLLDGGRRKAQIADAEATLDDAGQRYRSVVLGAFQQVEDQLAMLNHFGEAAEADGKSAAASQRALDLATKRYEQGAASYLEVVTAQTANLQSQRSVLDLSTRQRRAAVQLVRALGGGWSSEQLSSAGRE